MYKMIKNRSKKIELSLKTDTLLYDIKNYAFIEGDVFSADDEHLRHQIMDICEDGNIDRVKRVLDIAHANCVEAMYPYSKVENEDIEIRDNSIVDNDSYSIKLIVPDDFSKTTTDLIVKLIHEYMIGCVLSDWFSITKRESAENWREKANHALKELRRVLNDRIKRVRRTISPF